MNFRVIKYLLRANNLERKCRWLFGVSLLLLITGSFWWYGSVTEREIYRTKRRTGVHLVDTIMLKYHWEQWEKGEFNRVVVEQIKGLENLQYTYDILALEPDPNPDRTDIRVSSDPAELETITNLYAKYRQQLADEASRAINRANDDSDESTDSVSDEEFTESIEKRDVVSDHRWVSNLEEYQYYQPVYWQRNCQNAGCHQGNASWSDLASASLGDNIPTQFPFRVIKVMIPDSQYISNINRHRAIFMATAFVTVFLAMISHYVVVRFVIVKPLHHLRYVSDEVGRGNYALRAEIETDDEFEELADSYNRMLRHMIDNQEQLRDANTQLDSKLDQLAQMNMQLYEMNRLKSDFLANVSHELRTPLNSIIGFSDVLQGIDALNDKQKKYVTNIGNSGHALLDMINDILDLAKVESGKARVRPTEFAVGTLVSTQCDVVRSMVDDKNISLEMSCPTDLPLVFQDQAKVQQILTNLLSNAIKFTPDGGRIHVRIEQDTSDDSHPVPDENGWLVLSVEDTGVGIAAEDLDAIFEKFRQATVSTSGDSLTREFSGTGLGLSIVKELCRLLGGRVAVTSQLGQGSVFRIRLPWILPARFTSVSSGTVLDESALRFADFDDQKADRGRTPSGSGASVNVSTDSSVNPSSTV